MASLKRRGPGVVIQHERGPETSSSDPHFHAQVEQPRIPVPHSELAQKRGHNFAGSRAPGHGERLVFDIRSETARVYFYCRLKYIKENISYL